jgi:hypothetical protein
MLQNDGKAAYFHNARAKSMLMKTSSFLCTKVTLVFPSTLARAKYLRPKEEGLKFEDEGGESK